MPCPCLTKIMCHKCHVPLSSPFTPSSVLLQLQLQSPSSPLPPVNIQAVEAHWAEHFSARARLEQIWPPGATYTASLQPQQTRPALHNCHLNIKHFYLGGWFLLYKRLILRVIICFEHHIITCFTDWHVGCRDFGLYVCLLVCLFFVI